MGNVAAKQSSAKKDEMLNGGKIRALMLLKGIDTIKELADRVGWSRPYINNVILEQRPPGYQVALDLADFLGVTVDELRKKKKGGKHASAGMRRRRRNPV
jgi:transcriptional regulator with XRE-family HTH domain